MLQRTRASRAAAGSGRRWTCGRLAAALTCLLAALLPVPAGAAAVEPVMLRAAVHPGFGRLVFEWPRPITVERRQDGERLVLRFARPFAPDLATVEDRLGDYVSGIEAGADDREVALRLMPGVEAALATYEERIIAVDLTRSTADSAPPVKLRTGSHEGFVRIVLDWERAVGFEVTASGSSWRIVFDRAAEIDTLAIGQRFGDLLDEASSERSDGRSELRLALKPGVRAEVSEADGARVVIDLHAPVGSHAEAATADGVVEAPRSDSSSRTAEPEPAAGDATDQAAAPAAEPDGSTAAPVPLALRIGPAEDERGAALDFAWNRPLPAAFLIRAGYLWSVFAPPADEPVDLPSALPSPLPGHLGPGELIEASGGQAIRFALQRPLAAMAERDGARWRVVFGSSPAAPEAVPIERAERPSRLRISTGEAVRLVRLIDPEVGDELVVWPLLAAGRGQPAGWRLVELELLPTAQGLAWRARSDDLREQVSGEVLELSAGGGLRLSASQAAMPPEPAVAAAAQPAPPAQGAAGKVAVANDVSDAEAAMPVADEAARSMPVAQAAPDPTPRRERTRWEDPAMPTERPTVAEEQRRLVGPVGLAAARATDGGAHGLDLARFAGTSPERSSLQQRIAQAAPAGRPPARLELARWFLARALAPEALAVLESLDEPERGPAPAAHQLVRRRLAGAAALLLGRLDAASVLDEPASDDDGEIALWRAALAAAREDWPRGARELERARTVLAHYPAALRLRLGLPAAQAAIEAGDQDLAEAVLTGLAELELSPSQRAQVAFQQGLALARRGAIDAADEIWRALRDGPDYDSRVKATFARVQLLLDAGRLRPDEAVASLAPARALWRGHPWQPRMLERLAELYRLSGDRVAAVRTWHDLLAEFPALPDAGRIDHEMRATFAEALLQGEAIEAVRAYALYRDLPELMTEGAAGDALRRGLAEQLAALDLLEPAAALLDELVERRLSGAAKAAAGADLAELWLRAPDPAAALAALERSQIGDELPADLERRRRILHARALAAADRPAEALALLGGRRDPSEQELRAEILWQMRDWANLAATVESLLGGRADPAAALSEDEQELVIRLAIAYGQQADRAALVGLRARFGAAISGQAGEPAFLMATMTPGRPVAPAAVLAVATEHLDQVHRYLVAEPAAP